MHVFVMDDCVKKKRTLKGLYYGDKRLTLWGKLIKALTALMGLLSLSVSWENGLNGDARVFH